MDLWSLDPSFRIEVSDLNKSDTNEHITKKIYDSLSNDIFFLKLKSKMYSRFSAKKADDDKSISKNQIEDVESYEVLTTVVTNIMERNRILFMKDNNKRLLSRSLFDERTPYIKTSRSSWEQGIVEELIAMAKEQKRPYVVKRGPNSTSPLLLPNLARNENVRFLYDSDDLLETMAGIKPTGQKPSLISLTIGMITADVEIPSWNSLRIKFSGLQPCYLQHGLDDSSVAWCNRFLNNRQDEGECILLAGSSTDARKFLARGCPASLRAQLWRVALGLCRDVTLSESSNYQRLRKECDLYDFITDELYVHDVQTVVDDPKFFVFEDELKAIGLCFSRDDWIRQESHYLIHTPLVGCLEEDCFSSTTAMPPSGIQPFLGLALYFAPLGYLYRSQESIFHVCRIMYAKIWCKLNVISGDEGTLLSTCRLFEHLLMMSHPRLFIHLVKLGVQPLQVAFPWMHQGFVQYLEVDQVLHLWDRLIAHCDISLLAIFAVSIFVWRSEALLGCLNSTQVLAVLRDGSRLKVIPLLQMYLFPEGNDENSNNSNSNAKS